MLPYTFPVPNITNYDLIPVTPDKIDIGTILFSIMESQGEVVSITAGDNDADPKVPWQFVLQNTDAVGADTFEYAYLYDDPAAQPPGWDSRYRLLRRQPKMTVRQTLDWTLDGSHWIYPGDNGGKILCYRSGSTWTQGTEKYLGELTTDTPNDIYSTPDAEWDWIPVPSPGTVEEGDWLYFTVVKQGTVDTIDETSNDYWVRHEYKEGAASLGWADTYLQTPVGSPNIRWTFMQGLPNPDFDALFMSIDGAKWIYAAENQYFCFSPSTTYPRGSTYRRGEIAGDLTPIT